MLVKANGSTDASAAAPAAPRQLDPKAEAKIRKAWLTVMTASAFDKRWGGLPVEVRAVFTESKGNRAWMIGEEGKSGAYDEVWDRRLHQLCDTILWMQILSKTGYISRPAPRWLEVMAMAGYSVDSGDTASRDGVQNILNAATSWGVRKELAEDMAAVVGSTGYSGGMVEDFVRDPKKAVANVRRIVGEAARRARVKAPAMSFLDDPKELRAFAEVVLCVKLADASRGQYGQTESTLARSTMGRDPKIVQWKAAVDAERKPQKPPAAPVVKAR